MLPDPQILLITHDVAIASLVARQLEGHGLLLSTEPDAPSGVATCLRSASSLVVVDGVARGVAFPRLLHELRSRRPTPVIVIARDSDPALVAGIIDAGADDCVGRPVHPADLIARIRAVLRRCGGSEPGCDPICFGQLRIDPATRTVRVGADAVHCTSIEYDLVECLARRAGRVVARDHLFAAVRGGERSPLDRVVDVHMSRLRRKLRPYRQRIVTVRGVGYILARSSGQDA